jgi:hydrogenase expression/formation protein HypE
MYVSTFGVGVVDERLTLDARQVRPGDRVLLSGPIGDHGITILLARGELELEAEIESDTRAVTPFVEALCSVAASGVRWMRDPTRGGVATALNELARDAGVSVVLEEAAVPMRDPVRGACEILGLDPLHIANEGQFLAVVSAELAESGLDALRRVPGGEEAAIIGQIDAAPASTVLSRTPYGGTRVVDMLVGDPLPRIC